MFYLIIDSSVTNFSVITSGSEQCSNHFSHFWNLVESIVSSTVLTIL